MTFLFMHPNAVLKEVVGHCDNFFVYGRDVISLNDHFNRRGISWPCKFQSQGDIRFFVTSNKNRSYGVRVIDFP